MPSKSGPIVIPPPLHPPPSNSKDAIPTQEYISHSPQTAMTLTDTFAITWHLRSRNLGTGLRWSTAAVPNHCSGTAVLKTELVTALMCLTVHYNTSSVLSLLQSNNDRMSCCCFLLIIAASSIKQEQNLTLHAPRYTINLAQFKIFRYSSLHTR